MGALPFRTANEKRIIRIELGRITPSPYQARRQFDETQLRALADSIRRHGLLCPLLVRRSGDGYELIAGERRLRALRLLGRTHAEAVVTAAFDRDCALLGLVENLQREQLHFLDEAEACRRILREHRLTQEELAAALSRSPSALNNLLRLLRLDNDVRACIRQGGLSERHARALLRIEGDAERLLLARRAVQEGMSVRRLEEAILQQEARQPPQQKLQPRMKDQRLIINALQDTLRQLKHIGVAASSRVEDYEDHYELIISIRRQTE